MRIIINIIVVVINIPWTFVMPNDNMVTAVMVMVVVIYMSNRPFVMVASMLMMRHLIMALVMLVVFFRMIMCSACSILSMPSSMALPMNLKRYR